METNDLLEDIYDEEEQETASETMKAFVEGIQDILDEGLKQDMIEDGVIDLEELPYLSLPPAYIHKINGILAVDEEFGIGKNGIIPWILPNDIKFFYKTTVRNVVIMGRTTYFSISPKYRPLKDRINIILTKTPELPEYKEISRIHNNVIFVDTIDFNILDQLNHFDYPFLDTYWNYYIIGGKVLYELFMGHFDNLYITRVNGKYECDTFVDKKIIEDEKFIRCNQLEYGLNYTIHHYSVN